MFTANSTSVCANLRHVCHVLAVKWAKLCRESGIIKGKTFTASDSDLAFTQAKSGHSRRIDFLQFKTAVGLAALKLYPDDEPQHAFDLVASEIVACGGPQTHGTEVNTSGIYAKLSDTKRFTGTAGTRFNGKASEPRAATPTKRGAAAPPAREDMYSDSDLPSLLVVFLRYCQHAGTADSIDGRTYNKIMKDAKITGLGHFQQPDADLVYAKMKPPEERRMNFDVFAASLVDVAHKAHPGMDAAEARTLLTDAIRRVGGPILKGTATATDTGVFAKLTDTGKTSSTA